MAKRPQRPNKRRSDVLQRPKRKRAGGKTPKSKRPLQRVTVQREERHYNEVLSREVIHEEFGGLQTLQNPARVKVGCGHTIPQGDYASTRIYVEIDMPCDPEDKDRMFELLTRDVAEKIENELNK